MNAQRFSLALATLALLSTGASYAEGISANVGPLGVGMGMGMGTGLVGAPTVLNYPAVVGQSAVLAGGSCGSNIIQYPAVVAANACAPCRRTGYLGGLFGGHHTWFNVGAFGMGFKLGGGGPDFYSSRTLGANAMIYPSSYTAYNGLTGCGINTLSSVIPNAGGCGLSGTRIGNPWLDLSLFRFGFRAGTVNPNWDMRAAGDAY